MEFFNIEMETEMLSVVFAPGFEPKLQEKLKKAQDNGNDKKAQRIYDKLCKKAGI